MLRLGINSEHTEPWLVPLGKLVANFGGIELLSYQWTAEFGGRKGLEAVGRSPFASRVGALKALVESSTAPRDLKDQSLKQWNEALEIAKERNMVLHNPIVYGWRTADQSGPPDFLGVPDFKTNISHPNVLPVVTLAEINSLVNRVVKCAQAIHGTLADVRAAR